MPETQDKSCDARIDSELAHRVAWLEEMYSAYDGDDHNPDSDEALYNSALSVSKVETYRIQLSTGGPGDDFWVTYDRDDDTVIGIEYAFLDWFDGARRVVEGSAFDLVERYARQLTADFYV